MDIDINMNGADAVASKATRLSRSMTGLESAWSKYNRASRSGNIGGGILSGVGRTAGGAVGGSVIGGAVAFVAIEKLISSLMTDAVKNTIKKLVASDIAKWKYIFDKISTSIKPITLALSKAFRYVAEQVRIISAVSSELASMAALSMRMAALRMRIGITSAASSIIGKGGREMAGKASGAVASNVAVIGAMKYAKVIVNFVRKQIATIIRRVPLLTAVVVAVSLLMMDERISKWASKTMKSIIGGITIAIAKTVEGIGSIWGGFKMGLAKVTRNAYYANSQVNRGEAAKQHTPEQQTRYLRDESARLAGDNMKFMIKRTKDELMDIFNAVNEKRNIEIAGIQELMIANGRL